MFKITINIFIEMKYLIVIYEKIFKELPIKNIFIRKKYKFLNL